MKIVDCYKDSKQVVSLEVFPPKGDTPLETLRPALEAFKDLSVDYISVTCGAGGSARGNVTEIASAIKNEYHIEAMSHLPCVTCEEKEILDMLKGLEAQHIENVLALRGDYPQGYVPDPNVQPRFRYGKDLVKFIKENTGFCIAGAAYPEGHLECMDMEKNIEYLKIKVDSGADFLITQLFFHNENFYNFYDKVQKAGIHIPISVGIMPILNVKQIKRITTLCGAVIPDYLMKKIDRYEDKPEVVEDFGIEFASQQIQDLLDNGVDGVHIYSMNRVYSTLKIMDNISMAKAI